MGEMKIECRNCSAHYLLDEKDLKNGVTCLNCGSKEFSRLGADAPSAVAPTTMPSAPAMPPEESPAAPSPAAPRSPGAVAALRKQLKAQERRVQEQNDRIAAMQQTMETREKELAEKLAQATAAKQESAARLDKLNEELAAKEAALNGVRSETEEKEQSLRTTREELQGRVETLEDRLQASATALKSAEKALMQHRKILKEQNAARAAQAPLSRDLDTVQPDRLMDAINRSPTAKILAIALGVHLVLILLTSVRFLALCYENRTFDPKEVIRLREERESEAERIAERNKALAELAKKREEKEKVPAGEEQPEKEKSPIEKKIEEVSHESPKASTPSLDFEILE